MHLVVHKSFAFTPRLCPSLSLRSFGPRRSINRVTKAARLVPKKATPLEFTKSGARIYNKDRLIFNENKKLDWLAEHRNLDGAIKQFKRFEDELGVKPDHYTFGILVKAYVRCGKFQEALNTVEDMKKGN